ncbi:MAG: hypothetical protein Q8L48_23415 [Archangium sp.]|nr:hypothetical protein [Archangium sp.]
MSDEPVLERLIADGFVRRQSNRCVPAERWHAAVARAATSLLARGEDLDDLRVPVAWALSETYGECTNDEDLVQMVALMTPLTAVAPDLSPSPCGAGRGPG